MKPDVGSTTSPNNERCCQAICGDSQIVSGEVCDDGNTNAGDGCSPDCTSIEAGFACDGAPSYCQANVCTCPNGNKVADGADCPANGQVQCSSCNTGYYGAQCQVLVSSQTLSQEFRVWIVGECFERCLGSAFSIEIALPSISWVSWDVSMGSCKGRLLKRIEHSWVSLRFLSRIEGGIRRLIKLPVIFAEVPLE